MKLICNSLSPFARKVIILNRLQGHGIEEVPAKKDGANGYGAGNNPLGKIPSLEWKPDEYLFDSPVICEFLDQRAKSPLLPRDPQARIQQQLFHALGDGLADAVYNFRYETVRPEALHWDEIIVRHEAAINNSIDYLEQIVDALGQPWSFGNLAIICALDYANFRAGHLNWQARAPKLAKWHESFTAETVYNLSLIHI